MPPRRGQLCQVHAQGGEAIQVLQQGQKCPLGSAPLAVPPWQCPLGSARARLLRLLTQSAPGDSGRRGTPRGREPGPLGAQPLPRMRERAASKAADLAAFGPSGTVTSRSPRPRRCRRARRRRPHAPRRLHARRHRRRARRRRAARRALRATRATSLAGRRAVPSPEAGASPMAAPDLTLPPLLIAPSARGASVRRALLAPRHLRHGRRRRRRPNRRCPRCPNRHHPRSRSRRRRRRPSRRRRPGAKAAWRGRSHLCRRCPRRRLTEPQSLPRRRRRRGSTAASRRRAQRRRAAARRARWWAWRGWRVAV